MTESNIADLTGIIDYATNITVDTRSFVNYLDYSMRIVALIVHLVYIFFIFYCQHFQKRQMIYLHHVNIIGFIYVFHYCCYILNQSPRFEDKHVNEVLCYLSSLVWMVIKFLRMHSILLLAIYRYTAVYHIKFHRQFTENKFHMIAGILVTWIYSIGMSFILKYSFNTTYSIFYCFEGDSKDLTIVFSFMVLNTCLSIIIPSIFILFIYIRIVHKIKQLNQNLGTNKIRSSKVDKIPEQNQSIFNIFRSSKLRPSEIIPSSIFRSSNENTNKVLRRFSTVKKSKQMNFAIQLILINGANIFGSIFSILIIANLNVATSSDDLSSLNELQYVRPLFRFFFIFAHALIPFFSIILSPRK